MASLEHFTPTGLPSGTEEGATPRAGGRVLRLTPPDTYAPIEVQQGQGRSAATVGVLSGLAGAAVGAGAVVAAKLGKNNPAQDELTKKG